MITEKITSVSATLTTVVAAILAQFAPWLQTGAKATIAGAASLVLAWFTHEHQKTTRARIPAAPLLPSPQPVLVPPASPLASAAPPPAPVQSGVPS